MKIFLAKIFLGENFLVENCLGENFLGESDGGSDGVLHSCFLSKNLELMMLVMLNTVMMMIVHLTMWDGGRRGLSAVQATAKHWQIGKRLSETTPHYFLGITVYSVYSVYYTQPLRTEGDQGQTLSWRQGSDLNTQYLS